MWEHSIGGKADVEAMIKLAEDNYGSNSGMSSKKLITYQYFKNPCGEAYIDMAVDKDNGKLAGQYIVMPMEFYVEGKKCPCVLSMNTLTDKEYRGQGIFTGLAEVTYKRCAEEGRMFCYGSPNANSYHGFMEKLGFSEIGKIQTYVRPLLFYRHLKIDNVHVLNINDLHVIDEVWEKVKGKYPIMHVRDSSFIKYRYFDHPLNDYKIMYVNTEDAAGLIVGRVKDGGKIKRASVIDIIFTKGSMEAGANLIGAMLRFFISQKVRVVTARLMCDGEERDAIIKSGFKMCRENKRVVNPPLIYRDFTKNGNSVLTDCRNWLITMGDFDID